MSILQLSFSSWGLLNPIDSWTARISQLGVFGQSLDDFQAVSCMVPSQQRWQKIARLYFGWRLFLLPIWTNFCLLFHQFYKKNMKCSRFGLLRAHNDRLASHKQWPFWITFSKFFWALRKMLHASCVRCFHVAVSSRIATDNAPDGNSQHSDSKGPPLKVVINSNKFYWRLATKRPFFF